MLFTFAAVMVVAIGYAVVRRWLRRDGSATAAPDLVAEVTAGEREAAWAAAAAMRLVERSVEEARDAREAVALAETRTTDLEAQLERARHLLAEHTATANENHRLRGAVQALTDALTAMRTAPEPDAPSQGVIDALQGEIDGLRDELSAMEVQVKEIAEDRDRIAEEADRLRTQLEATGEGVDAGRMGRLLTELTHVRRSLEIERQRNLRLGRRRRDA